MATTPILDGLKVVEISAFVAAPLGGATLASLGAEVIRIDPPGGGIDAKRWPLENDQSIYWSGLNAGKKSLTIDMRSAAGQELATSLIAEAGIVLTNLRVHGWNEYERLRARRPDLIMAVLTGNPDGSTAVDYTVNAAIGFPFVTGPAGHEGPVNHVLPAWDGLAGYMLATGLLAAELHRVRTGEGQLINLSLTDVALSIAGNLGFIGEAALRPDEPRQRIGNDLFGTYSSDFRTSDGRYVIAVALTGRQWTSLIEATGIAEGVRALEATRGVDLRDEGVRYELRREIGDLVGPWIAAHTLDEVREAFDRHEVLWGPYQTFVELVANDPRCSPANPMFAEVDQPGLGRYARAGAPLAFSNSPRVPPRPSPSVGADTQDVLRSWLRLPDAEIARLVAERVI